MCDLSGFGFPRPKLPVDQPGLNCKSILFFRYPAKGEREDNLLRGRTGYQDTGKGCLSVVGDQRFYSMLLVRFKKDPAVKDRT